MINIAICDDDKLFTGKLETLLEKFEKSEHVKLEIDIYFDGSTLVDAVLKTNKCFDLIYLDIEMDKMDGIEAAKRIREKDEYVHLLYVTSHKSYAIKTFDVKPDGFLVKPIIENEAKISFSRVVSKILSQKRYFAFEYKRDSYKILVKDILYIESKKRKVHIHMRDGRVLLYTKKLNIIEDILSNEKIDFWRIHQSFLVNSRHIWRKSSKEVELTNGEVLCISEDRRKRINELYCMSLSADVL